MKVSRWLIRAGPGVSPPEDKIDRNTGNYQGKTYQGFARLRHYSIDKEPYTEEHEDSRDDRVSGYLVRPVCIRHAAAEDEDTSCGGTVENIYGKDEHVRQLVEGA